MTMLYAILQETTRTLALAAPFLLLGLFLAGLIHVLVSGESLRRWLGKPGMGGVVRAALVGIPLPVCSCGVVPLTVELRRKGASEPAALSFLITTPESSVDSILLTWGLMGPVMAVARPVAAFVTALVGGVLAIVFPSHQVPAATCCSGPEGPTERGPGLWKGVLLPSLRYGFCDLLDDLAGWLVLGVVAAGVVGVLVPSDLAALGLGGGWKPLVLALLMGIPVYLCASSSTPLAAALLLKGLSPGAVLVFLLAGPATNVASIVLLAKTFGRRFVVLQITGVVAGALATGAALDWAIGAFGLAIAPRLGEGAELVEHPGFSAALATLLLLLAWRLGRKALLRFRGRPQEACCDSEAEALVRPSS